MASLNLNKILNQFLDWKITFILHCGNDLLTNFCKRFLKFKVKVPKNERTTNNSFLSTVGIICLGMYNLSEQIFDMLSNYINRVVITFENTSQVFYFYLKIFHTGPNFRKIGKETCGLNIL